METENKFSSSIQTTLVLLDDITTITVRVAGKLIPEGNKLLQQLRELRQELSLFGTTRPDEDSLLKIQQLHSLLLEINEVVERISNAKFFIRGRFRKSVEKILNRLALVITTLHTNRELRSLTHELFSVAAAAGVQTLSTSNLFSSSQNIEMLYNEGKRFYYGEDGIENKSLAYSIFHVCARNGHPPSERRIGRMLMEGDGTEKNAEHAVVWLKRAADAGDIEAEYLLGKLYARNQISGEGDAAKTYLKHAADKSLTAAMCELGRLLESENDVEGAAAWYREGVERGDVECAECLGKLLVSAQRDFDEAKKYFEMGEKKNRGVSLNGLGRVYELEGDRDKAKEYYRRARDLNYVPSTLNLAHLAMETGDLDYAESLFLSVVKEAEPDASYGLGCVYERKFPQQLDLAYKHYVQAAKFGVIKACFKVANMLYKGKGVKRNLRKAFEYYSFCSSEGHIQATTATACMLELGEGVEQDLPRAKELFELVQDKDPYAAYSYACLLEVEENEDKQKVMSLFQKAADGGLKKAKDLLEHMRQSK